jgi:tRNA(Ile)-lysidine synthase
MYKQFKDFIYNEKLIDTPGTIMLGVSGGVDSIVMMDLFLKAGYNIAAAHCNFGLRGEESDQDQVFVAERCEKFCIRLHTKLFDTITYAKDKGISLQMAARELRYAWFELLIADFKYSYVAIAHNKNDLAETFLLNLVRGTGIRGLTGIKSKTGNIIRPLLFALRNEILDYAEVNDVPFREDSSNLDIKYKRNRIRHNILPEFEKISSSFINRLYETSERLKDVENIYSAALSKKLDQICNQSGEEYRIDINSLLALHPLSAYLYELLRKWNFSRELVPDIISSLAASPGKKFYSPSHRIVKDRDHLIVTPLPAETVNRYYVEEEVEELDHPLKVRFTRIKNYSGFKIPENRKTACLDLDLLHFPLIIRKWQKGDYFQPLGLSGLKKLSDFFIDNKLSLVEKEKVWLLTSNNRIAWVMGHRIDDRFKITERTKQIIMIELED